MEQQRLNAKLLRDRQYNKKRAKVGDPGPRYVKPEEFIKKQRQVEKNLQREKKISAHPEAFLSSEKKVITKVGKSVGTAPESCQHVVAIIRVGDTRRKGYGVVSTL